MAVGEISTRTENNFHENSAVILLKSWGVVSILVRTSHQYLPMEIIISLQILNATGTQLIPKMKT